MKLLTPKLLTPDEVADRLAVSPKIVRGWLREGKIPAVKLGRLWRVRPEALEAVIDSGFAERIKPARRTRKAERSPAAPSRNTRQREKSAPRARQRSRTRKPRR